VRRCGIDDAEPQFWCAVRKCGTGLKMVRRCVLRNRQTIAGSHHWL